MALLSDAFRDTRSASLACEVACADAHPMLKTSLPGMLAILPSQAESQ